MCLNCVGQGCFPDMGPFTTPSHHSQFAPLPEGKGRGCPKWIFPLFLTLAFCRTVPFPVTITDKGRFFKAMAELTGEFSVLFAGLALFAWTYNKNQRNYCDYRLLREIAAFSHHLLGTVSSHLHGGAFFQWHANFKKSPGEFVMCLGFEDSRTRDTEQGAGAGDLHFMWNKLPRRNLDAWISSCKKHLLAQPNAEGAEFRPARLWRMLLKAPQENTTTLLSPIHLSLPHYCCYLIRLLLHDVYNI